MDIENILGEMRIAKALILAAGHDDWEDNGPAHGEKDARTWKSKSTGEVRIQIEKPGTPSMDGATKPAGNTSPAKREVKPRPSYTGHNGQPRKTPPFNYDEEHTHLTPQLQKHHESLRKWSGKARHDAQMSLTKGDKLSANEHILKSLKYLQEADKVSGKPAWNKQKHKEEFNEAFNAAKEESAKHDGFVPEEDDEFAYGGNEQRRH